MLINIEIKINDSNKHKVRKQDEAEYALFLVIYSVSNKLNELDNLS
jgi:hypothetical protein